jgi:hypothetical protein
MLYIRYIVYICNTPINKNDMKTLQLIKEARSKKCDLCYDEGNITMMIGIRFNGKNTWHWFNVWEDGIVFFNHSYSCITGKVFRGLRHGMKIKDSLNWYNF